MLIVFGDPRIKVSLQLVDGAVDLFAECHPVELIRDRAMEALADAIGLRALGLGAAVVDVLNGQIERIRGSGCRRTRCRDRAARATGGCRARHKTAPPDH